MKKITDIVLVAAAFIAGAAAESWYFNTDNLYKVNRLKTELVSQQAEALGKAEALIDKHNLWDADGSDLMVEFINAANKADSLYILQSK